MPWQIVESEEVVAVLSRTGKKGLLPATRKAYAVWKQHAAGGPLVLKSIRSYNMHKGKGPIAGETICYLEPQPWRVQFIVEGKEELIMVTRIHPHEYISNRREVSVERAGSKFYSTAPIEMTPAEALSTSRKVLGLSQVALAKLSAVPQSAISAMESGRAGIGMTRARKLAPVLKVRAAFLVDPSSCP